MLFYIISNAILTIVPCAIMYWLGKKYLTKENATLHGAIFRSVCWSIIVCWTLLFVGGGMAAGIIPLPSWGAVIYWFTETDGSLGIKADHGMGIRVNFVPHILLSPAFPIAAYLLAYKLCKKECQTTS